MGDWTTKTAVGQRLGVFGCCLPRLTAVLTAVGRAVVNRSEAAVEG
eukprot:COSAG04_NODE_20353_length_395_cov_1.054054_1_plen_46_part_01